MIERTQRAETDGIPQSLVSARKEKIMINAELQVLSRAISTSSSASSADVHIGFSINTEVPD